MRKEVNPYRLPDDLKGKTIVEIGSKDGLYAEECLIKGCKKIYCFEPHPILYELLKRRLAKYDTRAKCYKLAVWRSDEHAPMLVLRNSKTHRTGVKGLSVGAIPFYSIFNYTEEFAFDYLCLNCPGSEMEILTSSGKYLSGFKSIVGVFDESQKQKIDGYLLTIDSTAGYLICENLKTLWERVTPEMGYFYCYR